jgi:hypothetical protein
MVSEHFFGKRQQFPLLAIKALDPSLITDPIDTFIPTSRGVPLLPALTRLPTLGIHVPTPKERSKDSNPLFCIQNRM